MFTLVEDGKITQMPKGNKGITLNGNQYPASIYTLWTEAERNAIAQTCLLYTSPSPRDGLLSRMPSSA